MTQSLTLYNTLTRNKEPFRPLDPPFVRMYVCGPTVYGHSHMGHAKTYVSFDVILRYLRYIGYRVTYIQNITDVGHLLGETNEGEDRLLKQSRLEQKHPMQIAEEYTRSYFQDMDTLGVTRPDISPRATGHIVEQIEMINTLIEKGFAYEVQGSVYFDVAKDAEYGKLSGRSTEEAEAGTRVTIKSEKRHPNDFALWKRAEPEHIMRWSSPWGVGFPGWHIECSAMSMKYLGNTLDIHGGGMDNQFPHHECEIAQSECATGVPFVRYWIHNNLVTVQGQKMSKSLGNVMLLKDAFKTYSPYVIRFFILQSHYRGTLDFTDEALEAASRGYERLMQTVTKVREFAIETGKAPDERSAGSMGSIQSDFFAAMNDDVNTPQAIAALFELAREANTQLTSPKPDSGVMNDMARMFTDLGGSILGIIPAAGTKAAGRSGDDIDKLMDVIIEVRRQARSRGKEYYWIADEVRKLLKEKAGIILKDNKDGSTGWS